MSEITVTQWFEAITAHTKALNALAKEIAGAGGKATGGGKASGGGKSSAPTLEMIQEKFGDYMSVQDKTERKARGANVKKINEKFGVEKASALDPKDFAKALEYLEAFKKGEVHEDLADEEEESPI
jgi:hypothetical protein